MQQDFSASTEEAHDEVYCFTPMLGMPQKYHALMLAMSEKFFEGENGRRSEGLSEEIQLSVRVARTEICILKKRGHDAWIVDVIEALYAQWARQRSEG